MVRDKFKENQLAGDAKNGNMKVDEDFVDPENHCEFCTRVEYKPGQEGKAGFSYEDPKGQDLSGAKKVSFWVMGEEGDENIRFKVAGKSLDKMQDKLGKELEKLEKKIGGIFEDEGFGLTTKEVTLEKDWKKYEVDVSGVDLKDITHPFAFELSGNGAAKEVVFIKGVVYDDEPAKDALATEVVESAEPLTAEIISNNTEGTAPATFEFKANVTGGTEPYSIAWDFDDDNESDEETISHAFKEPGTYNVTLTATDADNQTASDGLEVQIGEPEEEPVPEEPADNSTNSSNASTNDTEG